jgi:hypothetical protein
MVISSHLTKVISNVKCNRVKTGIFIVLQDLINKIAVRNRKAWLPTKLSPSPANRHHIIMQTGTTQCLNQESERLVTPFNQKFGTYNQGDLSGLFIYHNIPILQIIMAKSY